MKNVKFFNVLGGNFTPPPPPPVVQAGKGLGFVGALLVSAIVLALALTFASCGGSAALEKGGDGDGGGGNVTAWAAVQASAFGDTQINSVAYCKDRFIAVGQSGKMAYSADGTTWTSVTTGVTHGLFGVAYGAVDGADKFVAVGGDPKRAILYSTDGTTWTNLNLSTSIFQDDIKQLSAVIYDGGKFIAVGSNAKVVCSNDGQTWSKDGTTVNNLWCIASNGAGKEVIGHDGSRMSFKDYGSWSTSIDASVIMSFANDNSDTGEIVYGVAYGDGKFVAVGTSGRAVYSDGGRYTTRIETIFGDSTKTIRAVTFGAGKFVAVNHGGQIAYAASDDVTKWDIVADSVFGGTQINGIAYGAGKFVAVGASGKIAVSN